MKLLAATVELNGKTLNIAKRDEAVTVEVNGKHAASFRAGLLGGEVEQETWEELMELAIEIYGRSATGNSRCTNSERHDLLNFINQFA